MSTSPEMRVFKLTVKKGLLDCIYCRRPLHPNTLYATPFKCDGSHIFCSGCRMRHDATCVSHSVLLDEIISKLKFKYDCCDSGRKYIPYHELAEHLCDDVRDRHNAIRPFPFRAWGECILDTSALVCSECRLPLRPPIFRHVSRGSRVCSACYRGDITNYLHCSELDYLVEGISVECEACKQNLPFLALASHRLDDCPLKHKLQKIAPGSSIRENLCDEEETERPVIHGKNKRKRPLEAGIMDKHDDDSCDDNHGMCEDVFRCEDGSNDKMDEWDEVRNPETETVESVAENAFKTPCEKAEVAMPHEQETAHTAAPGGEARSGRLPTEEASSKPPVPLFIPRRPDTRSRKRALLSDDSTNNK
ncbi:hypothetical protein BS78_K060400 [Paspalum vaginatum]|uniref:Uncharacterized protein n=1 Tax=Paspalum vaginatum TaxID=158149 RepID=A0A9W8CFZ7_9POAL|nr:hypothetical protein BS78_K060400 [Paspalum vaginatum]